MDKRRSAILGGFATLLVLVGFNMVVSLGVRGCRADLTEEGLYSLSPGTLEVLAGLDETITLEFYWSAHAAEDFPTHAVYAKRVREFLEELVLRADGRLELRELDPEPYSEEEDRATAAGVATLQGGGANSLTLGLVARNSVDEQEVLPYLDPSREPFLEYEVVRLLHVLDRDEKPKVALVTSLPMDVQFDRRNPQSRPQPAWQVLVQMRELFEVEMVEGDAEALPEGTELLVLAHPKGMGEPLLRAVDDYVLGGGRVLAFLDPHCEIAVQPDPRTGMPMGGPEASQTAGLLEAWGVRWSRDRVVGDRRHALAVRSGGRAGEVVDYLVWLGLDESAMNPDDPMVGALGRLNLMTSGWFEALPDRDVALQPLVTSSEQSMPVEVSRVTFPDPQGVLRDFAATSRDYVLAARVEGTVRSAFPAEGEEAREGVAGGIVLVGDADMLADDNWIREERMGPLSLGWRRVADNGDFVLNVLEAMSGSDALLSLRGRGSAQRPFEKVRELRQEADQRFLEREAELEARIQEAEARIRELQSEKVGDERFILSPEQEEEIARLEEDMLEARKELRQVKHELEEDIERLGTRLLLLNAAGTPLAVAVLVLGWTLWRNLRRRARIRSRS